MSDSIDEEYPVSGFAAPKRKRDSMVPYPLAKQRAQQLLNLRRTLHATNGPFGYRTRFIMFQPNSAQPAVGVELNSARYMQNPYPSFDARTFAEGWGGPFVGEFRIYDLGVQYADRRQFKLSDASTPGVLLQEDDTGVDWYHPLHDLDILATVDWVRFEQILKHDIIAFFWGEKKKASSPNTNLLREITTAYNRTYTDNPNDGLEFGKSCFHKHYNTHTHTVEAGDFGVNSTAPTRVVRVASAEEDWFYRNTWQFIYQLDRVFANALVTQGIAKRDDANRTPVKSADLLLSNGPITAEMIAFVNAMVLE